MSRGRAGLRDRWVADVYRAPIGDACRVLLLLMASHMTDQGYVSRPREQFARTLNVEPRRVTERIGEAKSAGLLAVVRPGWRGHTAEYVATLTETADIANGYRGTVPISDRMGTANPPPFSTPKSGTHSNPVTGLMGTADRYPTTRALVTKPASGSEHTTEHARPVDALFSTAKSASTASTVIARLGSRRCVCGGLQQRYAERQAVA